MEKLTDNQLRRILLSVENPGRYAGNEYGAHDKKPFSEKNLKIALSYPDLYEIGMSNNALRILYSMFNSIENVVCDRVFAPAPDLEQILLETGIPLFTLENRLPLHSLDIMGFSFGYELTATNILNILSLGRVPVRAQERGEGHPVVIAGGPGITNPVPYGDFIDAFFIGEAEGVVDKIMGQASDLKKSGAGRDEILALFQSDRHFWHRGKKEKTFRAVYAGFGRGPSVLRYNPVPSVRAVQDHGVVEIMRGCPNGCRFCHAGYYYRPKREKSREAIEREVESLVYSSGYREITLSSLSSGDYSQIAETARELSEKYSSLGISFSLPSLKINSFTLPLLSAVSEVRKSGLTFAVETPDPDFQRSINKEVDISQTVGIIREARKKGWRVAKFYFMLGLPPSMNRKADQENLFLESDRIVDFLFRIQGETGININVNIGTFIPKPHTPYQWAAQMDEEVALDHIRHMRSRLKGKNIKLGYHSPMMSFVEGIFSRGDERAGILLHEAWKRGARLDAWEDHFDRHLWNEVIDSCGWDVRHETCRERGFDEMLPWSDIVSGVSTRFLRSEYEKSLKGELTPVCSAECAENCGACGKNVTFREADSQSRADAYQTASGGRSGPERDTAASVIDDDTKIVEMGDEKISAPERELGLNCLPGSEKTVTPAGEEEGVRYRVVFSFSKKGNQIYSGHLDIMRLFEKAFQRSGIAVKFTEGFNPKPRLEFASPLSLGMESEGEIAAVETGREYSEADFIRMLGSALPEGIEIKGALTLRLVRGEKIHSLMSLYSGSLYRVLFAPGTDYPSVLADFIKREGLESLVSIEQAEADSIRVMVRQGKGGKSMLKILKESTGLENPLTDFIVTRQRMYAGPEMTDYLSFFG